MQVTGNNNIQAQSLAASVQLKSTNDTKAVKPQSAASASVRAKYSEIIAKAAKGEEVDPVLVEEAKRFVSSGQFSDHETTKKAAENLLKYGI